MKKFLGKLSALVLAVAMVFTVFTSFAEAKSDRSAKSRKRAPAAVSAVVTLEDVEETALSHAGVDSASAVFSKEELDKGVYELKFSDPYGKYEYEISADDGMILDFEWDIQAPAEPKDDPAWEGAVSQEQAVQTALDDAGVDREALKYQVCYVSWKDHVPAAYEVKFATRWADYRYTIDLDTGAVLGSACYPHHR